MARELLKKYLASKEWNYIEKDDILKLDVNGNGFSWNSFLKVDEEYSFCYFAVLPSAVPEERRELFSCLLHQINCRIWFGNFEMILEGDYAGQVRLRTSTFLPPAASEETQLQLADLTININMGAMNFYGPILMKALYGESLNAKDYLSD